jgi:cell division septum initiation protein DivIVA
MSVYRALDRLETFICNSTKLPFDNMVIKRDKILGLIEKIRNSLPEEIKQARWISKENQRILQEAQEKADKIILENQDRAKQILKDASEEGLRLTNDHEVVVHARDKAQEILRMAEEKAKEITGQAEARTLEIIKKTESQASRLREEVEHSTTSLRNEVTAQTQLMKKEAEEFVTKVFIGIEREISRTLTLVQKARQQVVGDYKPDRDK